MAEYPYNDSKLAATYKKYWMCVFRAWILQHG